MKMHLQAKFDELLQDYLFLLAFFLELICQILNNLSIFSLFTMTRNTIMTAMP